MLTNKPSVLILDDEPLIVERIFTLLKQKGYVHVYTAANPQEVQQQFRQHSIDLFVSDIMLAKKQNGIDVVSELQQNYRFALVFVSGSPEEIMQKTLPVKPDAYIAKPFTDMQMIATLTNVWNNKRPTVIIGANDNAELSSREKEVLVLVCKGKTSKEIADVLSISPFTAQNHRAKIMEKLGVKNAQELISKAFQLGILT